eukprot:TRINITY_DN2472_c0_g1_i1.p1 TRINITY_DN2472_c0_g1~~TRINITY_DN2472_c0_g1_i1.p1  ORF type:complete len:675 (-),score=110.26 TRINITY_DN2472_c0_g1_i1:90-2114(-)
MGNRLAHSIIAHNHSTDPKRIAKLREKLRQRKGKISLELISSLWTIYSRKDVWRTPFSARRFLEDLFHAFGLRLDPVKMDQLLAEYHQQTRTKSDELIDFSDFKKLFNIAIHDILYQVSSDDVEEWKRMAHANSHRGSESSNSNSTAGIESSASSAAISSSSGLPAARSCAPSNTFSEAFSNPLNPKAEDQNVPIPPLWDWIVSLRPLPSSEETGALTIAGEKQLNALPRKSTLLLTEEVDLTNYEYLETALGALSILPLEVIVEKILPNIDEKSATKLLRCSKALRSIVLRFHKSFMPIRRLEIAEASVGDIILDLEHPKHRSLNMLLLEFREGSLRVGQQLLGIGAVLSPQLRYLSMCIKSGAGTPSSKTINGPKPHPGWSWPRQFAFCLRNLRQLDVAQFNNLFNSYDMSDWLMQVAKECVFLQELHIGAVGDVKVQWTQTLIPSSVLIYLFKTSPSLIYLSLILASPLILNDEEMKEQNVFEKCTLQHVMATHLFSVDKQGDPTDKHSSTVASLNNLLSHLPNIQSLELIALETYRRQSLLGTPIEIDYDDHEKPLNKQPAPLCWNLGESLHIPQLRKLRIRAKFVDEASYPYQQRKLVQLCRDLLRNHPNMKNITINPIKCCPPPTKEIDTEFRYLIQHSNLDSIVVLWAHFLRPGADRSSSKFFKDQI